MLTFSVPNSLILNKSLTKSAKMLGIKMYAHRSLSGSMRKTQEELAKLSGIGISTIRKCMPELEKAGYVNSKRHRYYDEATQTLRNSATTYELNLMELETGYTKLPRSLLKRKMTKSVFCVVAYLFCAAGHERRAYPSIKKIVEITGTGKSTVCLALQIIKKLPEFKVEAYITPFGDFGENSYYLSKLTQAFIDKAAGAVAHVVEQHKVRRAGRTERKTRQRRGIWRRPFMQKIRRWTRRLLCPFPLSRGSPIFTDI